MNLKFVFFFILLEHARGAFFSAALHLYKHKVDGIHEAVSNNNNQKEKHDIFFPTKLIVFVVVSLIPLQCKQCFELALLWSILSNVVDGHMIPDGFYGTISSK